MSPDLRILLVSTSTVHGDGYLDHVEPEIKSILGAARLVLFFPFALQDRAGYAAKATARFEPMGYQMKSAHVASDPDEAPAEADAIFVGGRTAFRLLQALQELAFIEPVQRRGR